MTETPKSTLEVQSSEACFARGYSSGMLINKKKNGTIREIAALHRCPKYCTSRAPSISAEIGGTIHYTTL
ncbi:unnamed protein product [Ixodes pacificus]